MNGAFYKLALLLLVWSAGPLLSLERLDEAQLRRHVEALERAGHYQAAVPYYRQLHRLAPQDREVVHGLVQALDAGRDFEAIVELLTFWLAGHPGDFPAYLRLGAAYAELGDLQQAAGIWRRALQHAEPAAELYLQVSDLCQTFGMYPEAIRWLLEGRQALGQPGLYSWELARLYIHQQDYPRAVEAYLTSLQQHPQRYESVENQLLGFMADEHAAPAIIQALRAELSRRPRDRVGNPLQAAMLAASCLLERGDPQAGLELLAGAADHPQIADLFFQYGTRAEEREYPDVALRAYSLLAARHPDSSYLHQALVRQAALSARRGDYAGAVTLYQKLASRYPDTPEAAEALFQAGRLHLEKLGQFQQACATFEQLLEHPHRDARTAGALELLAECALRSGDLAKADSLLAQPRRLAPKELYAIRFRRAELRYFQADLAGAGQLLEELLTHSAGHELANDALDLLLRCEALQSQQEVSASFVRAQLLERQHRYSEAARQWEWLVANAAAPLGELSLLTWAHSLAQRGEMQGAHQRYADLIARYPGGTYALEARVSIAHLYEQQGALEAALKAYETSLLAAPQDPRAPELRLRIERLRRRL